MGMWPAYYEMSVSREVFRYLGFRWRRGNGAFHVKVKLPGTPRLPLLETGVILAAPTWF